MWKFIIPFFVLTTSLIITPGIVTAQQKAVEREDIHPVPDLFYLVNSNDSRKRKLLKGNYTLYTKTAEPDTLHLKKSVSYDGQIKAVQLTSIIFDANIIESYTDHVGGAVTTHYEYLNKVEPGNPLRLRTIAMDDIRSIAYTTPSREFFQVLGAWPVLLGSIAVLTAPLFCINYSNGDFNANRYYTIAGSGLIGIGVGVPVITLLGSEKTYKITTRKDIGLHDQWYIVQE